MIHCTGCEDHRAPHYHCAGCVNYGIMATHDRACPMRPRRDAGHKK